MSGHSKWSNIKRKKAVIDAKRSGIFTKMANNIVVAVRKGGGVGDPDMNFALRLAVDKARAVNMPKENIERAIQKGMGKGDEGSIDELVLEGYGPHGVAIVIEATTDNRNRTVSEIKNILDKAGGSLGEPGSVMYQYTRLGEVDVDKEPDEQLELSLIDKGMVDMEKDEDGVTLFVIPEELKNITDEVRSKGYQVSYSSLIYKPSATTDQSAHADELGRLVETIQEHDDVQEVYCNAIW